VEVAKRSSVKANQTDTRASATPTARVRTGQSQQTRTSRRRRVPVRETTINRDYSSPLMKRSSR